MKSIEDHIEYDKKIADDPQANPAARRHAKEELHELEEYVEHHKAEIEAGDHHDPNALELGFSWYQEPSGKIWWTLVVGGQA